MSRAYSEDLRQRIVAAVLGGQTQVAVAARFAVSAGSVKRYMARHRAGERLAAARHLGKARIIPLALHGQLVALFEADPDATLATYCQRWEEQTGRRVSVATMQRAQRRAGWSRKKTLIAAERDEVKRAVFRAERGDWDTRQLVFVDESGCQTTMTPRYARAPKGKRAYGRVPRNHGKNVTVIASLTVRGMGAADTAAFVAYLRQVLLPTLAPGQIVVLDNLSVHKHTEVRRVIAAAGCGLAYLPPYSPDYMPIEGAFSKLKQYLRRVAARTRDALQGAIGAALDTITAADTAGWFAACGYPLSQVQLL